MTSRLLASPVFSCILILFYLLGFDIPVGKKALIVVLLVLAVGLVGVAVYLGLEISKQDQVQDGGVSVGMVACPSGYHYAYNEQRCCQQCQYSGACCSVADRRVCVNDNDPNDYDAVDITDCYDHNGGCAVACADDEPPTQDTGGETANCGCSQTNGTNFSWNCSNCGDQVLTVGLAHCPGMANCVSGSCAGNATNVATNQQSGSGTVSQTCGSYQLDIFYGGTIVAGDCWGYGACTQGTGDPGDGGGDDGGGTTPVTCYRCTQDPNDGDTCDSFTDASGSCPANASTNANGCAAAMGGSCLTEITVQVCGNGTLEGMEQCEQDSDCTVAGETCESCQCIAPGEYACTQIDRVDSDNVGPGDVEVFTAMFSGGTGQPYPESSVQLRVSSTADDTSVGSIQDGPIASDNGSGVWSYTFYWEATGLVNGDYDVELSVDSGATWIGSPCTTEITYDSSEQPDSTFLIIKDSTVVSSNTGVNISYTVTVTNVGPVQGVVDYVEDDLDDGVQDSWVSNIGSSRGITGSVSGGIITWTGTVEQRTYEPGESATFSYNVNIPSASTSNFADGVENMATVVYTPDQNRFTLVTPLSGDGLPGTGIMDSTPWIIGIVSILIGLISYKLGVGRELLMPVVREGKRNIFDAFSTIGLTGIERGNRKTKLEDKYR